MDVMPDPAHPAPADERERLQAAWNQLNLVLGFFSRIDAKLSVVLGIDLGMLALAGNRLPALHAMTWWMLLAAALFSTAYSGEAGPPFRCMPGHCSGACRQGVKRWG